MVAVTRPADDEPDELRPFPLTEDVTNGVVRMPTQTLLALLQELLMAPEAHDAQPVL